jgi:hypothetical protein
MPCVSRKSWSTPSHDVVHPGGLGGGDGGGRVVGADALCEQEELVDAVEGGSQCRWVSQVADDALGAFGQPCGPGGVADEET